MKMAAEARFGQTMRALRVRAGYTQEQLAERLKEFGIRLHFSAISKMESGDRQIRLNEAVALANILGVLLSDALESSCATCFGTPPRGFTCNECRSSS